MLLLTREAYTSKWRWLNTQGFRSLFIDDPGLATYNAEYSEYDVSGTTLYAGFDAWTLIASGDWTYLRNISYQEKTGISGTAKHYYPTPSIYPWNPSGRSCGSGFHAKPVGQQALWDAGRGSWAGTDLLMYTRPSELALGDEYFMPYLANGWSEREEQNLRPAQYLGICKMTMVFGASYFNAFFGMYTARPENYAWSTIMHTYAQAIASQQSDLFWNSSLMAPNDYPVPPRGCFFEPSPSQHSKAQEKACEQNYGRECSASWVWRTRQWTPPTTPPMTPPTPPTDNQSLCHDPRYPPVNYRFWTGSQSVVVVARKDKHAERYLIMSTVQPQSNMVGNAPLNLNVSFQLNGHKVHFESRRQGSVYVLDDSGGSPTLTQLDKWHEAKHPSWWSHDFHFEAEAHYQRPLQLNVAETTEVLVPVVTEGRSDASSPYDFVGAKSYVKLVRATTTEYRFTPRRAHHGGSVATFRVVSAGRGGCVNFTLGGDIEKAICFPEGRSATIVRAAGLVSVPTDTEHVLRLRARNSEEQTAVDVDWLRLEVAESSDTKLKSDDIREATMVIGDIFVHGDGGFPCWRVPAVVMAKSTGRLFAFAEARNHSGDGCEPAGMTPNASHPSIIGKPSNSNCMKSTPQKSDDGGHTKASRRTVVGCHECAWSEEWNEDLGFTHYNFSLLTQLNFHSAAGLLPNGTLHQSGINSPTPARHQCDISDSNSSSLFTQIREKCKVNDVRLVLSIGQPATTAAEMLAFLDDKVATTLAIKEMTAAVVARQVGGLSLDWEGSYEFNLTSTGKLVAFFGALRTSMRSAVPDATLTYPIDGFFNPSWTTRCECCPCAARRFETVFLPVHAVWQLRISQHWQRLSTLFF